MVKIFELAATQYDRREHEEQQMGTTFGLRDSLRQPGAFVAERIPRGGESHPEDQVPGATEAFRPGTDHAGRNRKAPWPQSAPRGCLRCQTRHHSGLVSKIGRPPVSSEVEA